MSELGLSYVWGVGAPVGYVAPGSPWNGFAVFTQPVANYFSPNLGLPSNDLNWVFQAATTTAKATRDYVSAIDCTNWPFGVKTFHTGIGSETIVHDPVYGRWLGLSGGQLYVNYDPGFASPATLGSATVSSQGLGVNPSTGEVLAIDEGGHRAIFSPITLSWTSTTFSSSVFDASLRVKVEFFNNQWVVLAKANGSAVSAAAYINSSNTSFTLATGTLPADSTTSHHYVAKSSSLLLFFTDQDGTHYASTPDGQTYTQQSFPTLPGGHKPIGAGYSSTESLFYVATSDGSSTTNIYSSTTGLTGSWTLVKALVNPCCSFASRGRQWAVIVTSLPLNSRVAVSPDQGTSWYVPKLGTLSSSAIVKAGSDGFYTIDAGNVAASLAAGYPSAISL